jgi:ATP-dependent exoDNAse (exonuclease V) alpha subunit
MIADICIHAPDRRSDDRNHHAHIMLTMRELTGEGFGKKARDWNESEQLERWRETWAAAVNRALEENAHAARVDHRSLAARGIDREPEPKQGAVATAMEQEGRPSYAGADRRAARERNRQRESLGRELATIINDLEAEEGREEPPAPARTIRKAGWTRYLCDLWQTVARGVTRPVVVIGVLFPRRRRPGLTP